MQNIAEKKISYGHSVYRKRVSELQSDIWNADRQENLNIEKYKALRRVETRRSIIVTLQITIPSES